VKLYYGKVTQNNEKNIILIMQCYQTKLIWILKLTIFSKQRPFSWHVYAARKSQIILEQIASYLFKTQYWEFLLMKLCHGFMILKLHPEKAN
jgi:hypothetical protein